MIYDFNEEQKENILKIYPSVEGYILNDIRRKRQKECFDIINRGQPWYENNVNTEERKTQLDIWYQEWLNATETKVIPTRPGWIK